MDSPNSRIDYTLTGDGE